MRNFDSPAKPLIYLITDGTSTVRNFSDKKKNIIRLVGNAVEREISLVQLREKQLPARMIFEIASEIVKIAKNTKTKILINDRADIASAANAGGVHLTASSLSAEIVRRSFSNDLIVGVSAHTLEAAETAKNQGADFVTFSPIFHSPGKGKEKGIEELEKVCRALSPFPVIALGGIDASNFAKVLEAGASGFASIRYLNDKLNDDEINY